MDESLHLIARQIKSSPYWQRSEVAIFKNSLSMDVSLGKSQGEPANQKDKELQEAFGPERLTIC